MSSSFQQLQWWVCSSDEASSAPCLMQVALPDTEVDLFGQQVLEQSLASGDTVTKAIYFVVLIFCAPFWEEVSPGANALAVQ